jgi:hypothetical protein
MRRLTHLIAALLVACTTQVGHVPGPVAHTTFNPNDWFKRWDSSSGLDLKWRWTNSVPSSYRAAIYQARLDWTTAPLDWKRETPDYANYDFRDCASIPWRKNAVHAVNDVTKPIAWVQPCYGTFLNKVSVVINLAYPWHTDPNTLPAWNEIDLRGFATHEWGHSNGQMIGGDYSNAGHFLGDQHDTM